MLARTSILALLTLGLGGCYDGGQPGAGASEATTGTLETSTGTTGTTVTPTTGEDDPGTTSAGTSSTSGEPSDTTTGDPTTGLTTTSTDDTSADESTGDALDDCPRLRVNVAPDPTLNVRPTPSTAMAPVAQLVHGQIVETLAAVQGESIEGNTLWYQIVAPAGYVSGVFVECTTDPIPEPPAGFYLPFACDKQVKVTQGNNGGTSHTGKTMYAFDFGLGLDTPVHASAPGVVTNIFDETGPGDPCYGGGGPECGPYGNLVIVLHGDGTTMLYKHLNKIEVTLGQQVARGDVVGLSGTTGYSTGPHLHTMRMENCGLNNCQSIPLEYVEAGVPVEGQLVTSQNCP